MKNLILIIHANTQQDVADLLRGLEPVQGFTFSRVEGHGKQVEHDPFLSPRDKVVGYTPRIRIDILLNDEDVDTVLDAFGGSVGGKGIYWVTSAERHGLL